jgi:mono/diheme cytochrome c family protein
VPSPAGVSKAFFKLRLTGSIAVVGAIGVALSAGRSLSQQRDPNAAFRDSVATRLKAINAGRAIFHGEGTCFGCHGPKLEGTAIAPTLRAHKWRNGDGSLEMILKVLHNGVPNTAMISHPGNINETELQQVATYVWAVSRGAVPP